jgi:hypothetical protein
MAIDHAPLLADGRRFLALHLPYLPIDRLRRTLTGLRAGQPLAAWAATGNRRLLAAVDQAAAAQGIHAGQPLADAQAMPPLGGSRRLSRPV